MNNAQLGIVIGLGISTLLLYSRKSKWYNPKWLSIATGILFLVGLIGIQYFNDRETIILFLNCGIPLIYFVADRILKKLSLHQNSRDFILWLRGSNEIDDRLDGENPHVKPLDQLISIGLLIFIIVLVMVSGTVLPGLFL